MCLQTVYCCPPKILDWRREVGELLLQVVSKAGDLQFVKEKTEEERKARLEVLLVDLVLELVFVQPGLFSSPPSLHPRVFAPFPAFFPSYQGSPLESLQISPDALSLSSLAAEWVRTFLGTDCLCSLPQHLTLRPWTKTEILLFAASSSPLLFASVLSYCHVFLSKNLL